LRLTILSVAYPLAPVSFDTAGGAEQVLASVEKAAVEAGHRSLVIACEGSKVAGELIAIPRASGTLDEHARRAAHAAVREAIAHAIEERDVDLLHFHGIDFHEYMPAWGPPAVITLHLPPDWYPPAIWQHRRPHTHMHCVSQSQQRRCPEGASLADVIPNGIDLGAFRPRSHKAGFALMLGRICPEKGFHLGLDAASCAGVPLWIGGEVYAYAEHEQYFAEQVAPRITGTNHRFLGPVDLVRKRRLLRAAKCVLIPSLAPETSSLVAMEAMASGTPVIAFRSGALPEVVEDGRTGFLVNDACQMGAAMKRAGEIDSKVCRRVAEERFSAARSTARYLDSYRTAFEEEWRELQEACPAATPFSSPEWLSPWPLEIVTVRRQGRLVALAALGPMPQSDYRDVLAVDQDAADRLWDKLPPCVLDELPPDSPILMGRPAEDASWCPFVPLVGLRLASKLEKNLRLQRRKLESLGGTFEVADASQTEEYLEALFQLHTDRWSGEGVLGENDIQDFHRKAAPAFAARGWLRFHGIRIEGELRAVLYAFACRGRIYYYLSGFDPALEPYGPGNLLIQAAIRHGIAEGDTTFDFLRGTEPYKYRWGAANRINRRLVKTLEILPASSPGDLLKKTAT
jgi:glycosyltransferase involved in cell wall biosynthesis